MKITLICVGKTDEKYLNEGIEKYTGRLKHYITFGMVIIPDLKNSKNMSQAQQKEKEAALILKHISPQDTVVLLDEYGKEYRSVDFSRYLEKNMLNSTQHLVFVIGGPYGFDQTIYDRSVQKISLSKMTFSHQMIRLFFVEQVYRAFSILKGEPYHHE
ncbi:putative rRNA large subunit m3Psi methyltransferase RlmH [Sphingobacterium spiritivorum ATCC 33300]|uniref:Ribosomal RNA large subunit methyltransferase H n=2 Tax=Sphingobacterium spiritivorum TaxID=258 RepID=A0A380CME7_SPHSI|nr:23S rRNA (pseudouridine(1915)-N(3))-methyltransferase RlmH [Sphingobacterium spiritivorum]EEI92083.1 putative rRNA large subunit m3Psi methyltransferase RlmH [Sphingobacterium spiritivorum ATCC 33300]QQS96654.1 23S rRNA (pseudouridine(1915)-N(3))-methyltransferase RlmH [Sphingobacterium spiritivorum]SUJ22618.1 Ribosomal RNA large subunit methyltransferase H [Sphingobacterium spiritivorum]